MASRLSQKLFFALAAMVFALVAPFVLFVYFGARDLAVHLDRVENISTKGKALLDGFAGTVLEGAAAIFIVALVVAYFASGAATRQILIPIREMMRGLKALGEGDRAVRLSISREDELGKLVEEFNRTAKAVGQMDERLGRSAQYLEAMIDPVWVTDQTGRITEVNPAFTEQFGYTPDEAVGSNLFDFLEDNTEQAVRRRLLRTSDEEFTDLEGMFISKRGGLTPVLLSSSNLTEEGIITGRVGIIKDFRGERDLIEALQAEKERTDMLMDSLSDIIVLVDREYRIIRANRAARLFHGEDPSGMLCHEALVCKDEKCFFLGMDCPAREAFNNGTPQSVTLRTSRPDGTAPYLDIQAFPVTDSEGEISSVLLSLRDVSDRMAFEEKIEQKNRELEALNTISKVLSRSLRSEDTHKEVLDRIIGLFSMDGGGIYLADDLGRKLNCTISRGLSVEFSFSTRTVALGSDIPGIVAERGKAAFYSNVSTDPRADGSVFQHSGLKGFACVPIRGSEKVLGVFFVFSHSERPFTDSDESIMLSISEIMGISFENTRLYERMRELYRQDRDRRVQERRDLLKLASLLASSLDMKRVLESSMALIKESCWADFAWMLTYDQEGSLRLAASTDSSLEEAVEIYPLGADAPETKAAEERKPVILRALGAKKGSAVHSRVRDYATACLVPVYLGDRTLGAFGIYYLAETDLSEEELHFMHTVGSVISVALERARLYDNALIQRGMANAILESITDGVITVDGEGRVTSINRAAQELFNVSESGATGALASGLPGKAPENKPFMKKLSQCINDALGGSTPLTEGTLSLEGGVEAPIMLQCSPVYGKDSGAAGAVVVLRNLGRERELDRLKTEFVRSVSQEFRSPLASIEGMAEMLIEGDVDGERARTYLDSMLSETLRLSNIVSDVLDLAKMESGAGGPELRDTDLREVVSHVADSTAPMAERKGIRLAADLAKAPKTFNCDRELMMQLLRNLVENAITYSGEGAEVKIRVTSTKKQVTISVRDTGPGIPEGEINRVSERFYRGSTSEGTTGTGLGLSLCREIAHMHGGALEIESAPGEGTKVTVKLPLERK
jgi:PAS domain S-box-containing protein